MLFHRHHSTPKFADSTACSRHFPNGHLLGKAGLTGSLARSDSAVDTELSIDAVHTMGGVQVFLDHDLEAGCAALPRRDDGPSEEELPDLKFMKVSDSIHSNR